MNILTKTWVGSDEAVLGVPHWLLVVQKLRQIFQKLKKLEKKGACGIRMKIKARVEIFVDTTQ